MGFMRWFGNWKYHRKTPEFSIWLTEQATRLSDCSEPEAAGIALTVMTLACRTKNYLAPNIVERLTAGRAPGDVALSHAAAWALAWMNNPKHEGQAWHPNSQQLHQLLTIAGKPDCDSEALRFLSWIFKTERTVQALDSLLLHLPNSPLETRQDIVQALGAISDSRATDTLLAQLQDTQDDSAVRQAAAEALGQIKDPHVTDTLLARLQDTQDDSAVRQAAAEALGRNQRPSRH